MSKSSLLTSTELILLHLLKAEEHEESKNLIGHLTQDGIALWSHCSQSTISRRLPNLKDKGLISSARDHMGGYARTMRYYYLTEEGKATAENLKTKIDNLEVEEYEGKEYLGKSTVEKLTKKWDEDGLISQDSLDTVYPYILDDSSVHRDKVI